jgi:hypothetical protein
MLYQRLCPRSGRLCCTRRPTLLPPLLLLQLMLLLPLPLLLPPRR